MAKSTGSGSNSLPNVEQWDMEPRTKTCGPYPGGLMLTHTQLHKTRAEPHRLPREFHPRAFLVNFGPGGIWRSSLSELRTKANKREVCLFRGTQKMVLVLVVFQKGNPQKMTEPYGV